MDFTTRPWPEECTPEYIAEGADIFLESIRAGAVMRNVDDISWHFWVDATEFHCGFPTRDDAARALIRAYDAHLAAQAKLARTQATAFRNALRGAELGHLDH